MRPLLPTAVLLAVLAASTIGAVAPDPREVPAVARTSVQLLDAGVTHVDGSVERATLGQLRLRSLRDGAAWAGMDLVGAETAREQVAAWQVTTDDSAESSGDARPTLSPTHGIAADLQLVDYLVRALDGEATSRLSGIQGELGLAPLSLQLGNVGPALVTEVDDRSSSTTSLALGHVVLTLADLFPPGLVDQLPLGVLIDLLGQLPVSVPTVEDLVTRVDELVTDLTAVVDADAALDEARAELNDLVGDAPGVTEAEAAVASAEQTLVEATSALDDLLADREAARTLLADAEAELADTLEDAAGDQAALEAARDAAEAAEATAEQAVDAAEATLTTARQELADAEATLAAAEGAETSAQQEVDDLTADNAVIEDTIDDLEAELLTLDSLLDAARILQIDDELETLEAEKSQLQAGLQAAQDDLADVIAAVTAAESAVSTAQTAVTSAEAALADAEADLADAQQDLADATDALADAVPAVGAAQDAVADAEAALATIQTTVSEARATGEAAEDALVDAMAELDALVDAAAEQIGATTTELRERIIQLRGEVEGLLDQVISTAAQLPDLASLLDELRGALAGVPVVSLGGVSLDIALDAHASGATSEVRCSLDSISVFGRTLSDPSCDEASELLTRVPAVVADLLSVLPIDDLPLPRIAGLIVTTDASDGVEDGVTWARARVTGLALEVPSVSLSGLSDALTNRIDGLLADALSAARALPTGELPALATGFSATSVLSTLSDLRHQLDGLPVGGQLEGLGTLGIDLTVGHFAAEALHGATATDPLELGDPYDTSAPAPPAHPGGSDPGAPPEGDDPTGAPAGPPSLPATGGGLGLLSLALMGGALALRRRTI